MQFHAGHFLDHPLDSYENFGVVIPEAMVSGLSVLVTPGVAFSSVVQQQGIGFVIEQNIDSIASTIDSYPVSPQKC